MDQGVQECEKVVWVVTGTLVHLQQSAGCAQGAMVARIRSHGAWPCRSHYDLGSKSDTVALQLRPMMLVPSLIPSENRKQNTARALTPPLPR